MAFTVAAAGAESPPPVPSGAGGNEAIATTALRSVGRHGGQCWEFMQQVVKEVTGQSVVGDYREAYFAAGAIEVSWDRAAPGDILQLTDPAGGELITPHTAIIVRNLGERRYDAVDSNQQWDEVVRLRAGYEPFTVAAQRGGVIHIYRMPAVPISTGDGLHVTPASHSWTKGETLVVTKADGCLNLRRAPSLDADPIACLPRGTAATATGETAQADTYTWAKVHTPSGDGWLATAFVAILPAQQAATKPAAGGSAVLEADARTRTDQGTPARRGWLGARAPRIVRVDASSGCLNLRSGPGVVAPVIRCLSAGTTAIAIDESPATEGPAAWTRLRLADGSDGWAPSAYLIRLAW